MKAIGGNMTDYPSSATVCGKFLKIEYDAGQSMFVKASIDSETITCTAGGTRLLLPQTDNFYPRYIRIYKKEHFGSSVKPVSGAARSEANLAISISNGPELTVIGQIIDMNSHYLALEQNGIIIWDDKLNDASFILGPLQRLTDFLPKFAFADRSIPCTIANCDVATLEIKTDNKFMLTMLNAKVNSAPNVGSIKFPSLDVTSVATVNMPVPFPKLRSFFLVGATKFHLYLILDDKFVATKDYESQEYSNMVPNSLIIGSLDSTVYPDKVIAMAMFQ